MNRITLMGALAALALIMAPGFSAQAANPDTSPDVNAGAPAAVGDIETPDTGVGDDVGEVEAPEVEDVDVADVGDIETPDVEAPEVEAPEVEAPELGE